MDLSGPLGLVLVQWEKLRAPLGATVSCWWFVVSPLAGVWAGTPRPTVTATLHPSNRRLRYQQTRIHHFNSMYIFLFLFPVLFNILIIQRTNRAPSTSGFHTQLGLTGW